MSRQSRFEIVRTTAGWHARFRAANGRIVWVTEVYRRRATAKDAIYLIAPLWLLNKKPRDIDERSQP